MTQNAVCALLGIKHPVFQGGMAWVSDAGLASAVSNAGGLGIIAAGNAPADVVRSEIRRAKELTDKPFAVNILMTSPYAEQIAGVILEEFVKVVVTGAGTFGKYISDFKQKGIKYIPVVPSVAIARNMERNGADAVIAEGMEAGGHIGKLTTMALVPQVADAVSIPVIAAGGIADGRGMAAAFMLGAQGVQIGTRFVAAKECSVHQNFKDAILKARDIDTVITGQITGHPVRSLRNKLTARFLELEKEEAKKDEPDLGRISELGIGTLRKAAVEGDAENGTVPAGQIAGLVKKEQSCAEIIDELMAEFKCLIP